MLYLLRSPDNLIYIDSYRKLEFHPDMIRRILTIGIPNGLENGMFQIGKILVQGLIAGFGTVAIAANAVANNIAQMEIIPAAAIGLAMITVVGQCVGAGDYAQARLYIKKLMKIAYISMLAVNLIILCLVPLLLNIYNLSAQTYDTALELLLYHAYSPWCCGRHPSPFPMHCVQPEMCALRCASRLYPCGCAESV